MFMIIPLILTFSFFQISPKLISAIEINRHGARNSENFNNAQLQEFFGFTEKLTQNGYRQQQILGHYMNQRYIQSGFISQNYTPKDFTIISTPTQRTVFSANGFISGLFPGHVLKTQFDEQTLQLVNDDTIPVKSLPKFKEIPMTVISWKENSLFNAWECKLNGEKIKKTFNNKDIYPDLLQISTTERKTTAKFLAQYFNIKDTLDKLGSKEFLAQIVKHVKVYLYHYGIDIDKGFPSIIGNTIKKTLVNKRYAPRTKDSKMLRVVSSEFLQKVIDIFDSASCKSILNENKYSKYIVYSSHDKAIINILTNLFDQDFLESKVQDYKTKESYNFLLPPFASHLLFELHFDEIEYEYYVQIIYNGEVLNAPLRNKAYSFKDGKMNLRLFKEFLRTRIENEWEKVDCSNVVNEEVNYFPDLA